MSGTTNTRLVPSRHVPGPVPVVTYLPGGHGAAAALPLLLLLHGGDGSAADLAHVAPLLDDAIASGALAPIVVAMPSAGRSLYMDFMDGSERWESFIVADLLPALHRECQIASGRDSTFVGGWSMGGLGALRLAFKYPSLFAAVAAVEPAIEPALDWAGVGPLVKFWRPDAVYERVFGSPVDTDYWGANNPASIAACDPERLLGLGIYIEVGDQDMLHLFDGVEFLHRLLFDARIGHEYRLVHGAEHVGQSLAPRLADALGFIGRQIAPPGWVDESVVALRGIMDDRKRAIGLPAVAVDPRRIR